MKKFCEIEQFHFYDLNKSFNWSVGTHIMKFKYLATIK